MPTTVVQQPQHQPQSGQQPAHTGAPAGAANDQAASTALVTRRQRSAAAVPPPWATVLGGLLPPEATGATPTITLRPPAMTDLRRGWFRLAVQAVPGQAETKQYLSDASADQTITTAFDDVARNVVADTDAFNQLRTSVAQLITDGDLNLISLRILATLALTTEDGKQYLRLDDTSRTSIVAPLTAHIAATLANPADVAGQARKTSLQAIANAILHPVSSDNPAATQMTPAPLTPAQQRTADALLQQIRTQFPANAQNTGTQPAPPSQLDQTRMRALLATITGAEPRVREWLYAWRDQASGQGVLQLLGTKLSPSQVEQVIALLDPVEALRKQLDDAANSGGNTYQLMYDFLAGHLGDQATRTRFRNCAPIMQNHYQRLATEPQRQLLRMIVSGRIALNAVDKLHDAAEAGDSAAAVSAIYELGQTPSQLQTLRTDLVFVHRLQDKCNARIAWHGIELRPYDLFLKMCGVDANDTHEAGSLQRQGEINPSPTPLAALTPQERAGLDAALYTPHIEPIKGELNATFHTSQGTVMSHLATFQRDAAQPANVELLRRAHEAPGPELARRIQAAGCDVRLKIQPNWNRGLSADNLITAERIFGFATDQAAVGVIGGQGALATDNRVADGQNKVPLEQALRETVVAGQVLTQVIHDKAQELANELGRWLGARADHVSGIWDAYRGVVSEPVCTGLRDRTGLPRVWAIELLANAFVQVGGAALQTKLQTELGRDHNDVIQRMGMQPTDVAARRQMAQDGTNQTGDATADHSALAATHAVVDAAAQAERFKSPAADLFSSLATIRPFSDDTALTAIGGKLHSGLGMAAIAAPSPNVTVGPVLAPTADRDPGARPGGPAHPNDPAPTDFKSYYRHTYGIDPTRHVVEVARALATPQRSAAVIGRLLGVDDPNAFAAVPAPTDAVVIDESNRTLVGPDFTPAEANHRAQQIWDLLHTNGQIQLIRERIDGRTQEEQRLINIAFRNLSGGIDLAFYIQQHLAQIHDAGGNDAEFAVQAGGEGAHNDTRRMNIVGTTAETEAMLEVAQKGRVSLEGRLTGSIKANNMDDVYAAIEGATAVERRAILANPELMSQLRAFGDDSYEWNRIYKGLSGESDMFDRLESRAHGRHGFIGAFEGTDEKGMSTDIRAYAHTRKVAITREIVGGDGAPNATQQQQVDARLRAEFQSLAENPSIRAILQDELSGTELAQREGMLMNSGEDNHAASALTEGDWTEDEEKIIDDIKHMTPAERQRLRNDPEYINQLHKAIQTQATWRDAMIALDSDVDGSKAGAEDNFGTLERASRGERQDTTELMFERDDVIESLSKLTPAEFRRVQNDPAMQAQIYTSLEGDPEKLALAHRMLAFNAGNAGAMTGLQIGDHADPSHGVYSRDQVERVAYLKFNAVNRLKTGALRSWGILLQAAVAVYNMKLRPSQSDDEGGGAAPGGPGADGPAPAPTTAPAPTAGTVAPAHAAPNANAQATAPTTTGQAPATNATAAPAGPTPADPAAAEAAIETRLRTEIWNEAQADVLQHTNEWGKKDDLMPDMQQRVLQQGVMHLADPSSSILTQATSMFWNDNDRVKDTLKNASDEKLINDWTTVKATPPSGGPSLKDVYQRWKTARLQAAATPSPAGHQAGPGGPGEGGAPMLTARVGSPEWEAQVAFRSYAIDTSRRLEQQLLTYAGGLFSFTNKPTADGDTSVRDNKEWLEWRSIIRDRIPALDKTKIAVAIDAANDPAAQAELEHDGLRSTLEGLRDDEERYQVDRGANSNYNMDRVTAGGQGLAMDNAMGDYRREVLTSVVSQDGQQYGQISAAEQSRIGDAKARFNQSSSDFRAAKSAVAQIAATVVALIITAVVTILTAGTATGPVAVILLGALTAGAASVGSNAAKKAVQGTDFTFTDEGLKSIARDTVMGAVMAGTTWYAGEMTGALWNTTNAAQQAELIGEIAAKPTFIASLGRNMTEQALQTGMQGVVEVGMAPFDPAMWLDGWSEGWRRGTAAARHRAQEIPGDMMKAAVLAAITHSAGRALHFEKAEGGQGLQDEDEAELEHAALGNRSSLGDRAQAVGKRMIGSVGDGLIQGTAQVVLDERTWRSEGLKLTDLAGSVGGAALDNMKNAATSLHVDDAQAVMRVRAGGRELALHGQGLTPAEQQVYAQLAMRGGGTTVLSIESYKSLRNRVVEEAIAKHEAETHAELAEAQKTSYETYCRNATSLEEFHERVEKGPSKQPGTHVEAPHDLHFDEPALRSAEVNLSRNLVAKLGALAETSSSTRKDATAIRTEGMQLAQDGNTALRGIAPSSAEGGQAAELRARIDQATHDLTDALTVAASGPGTFQALRADLQAKLQVAQAAQGDHVVEAYEALHASYVAASMQKASLPQATEEAVPQAQAKLAELRDLVAQSHALADTASRHAANHDDVAATASTPVVTPTPVHATEPETVAAKQVDGNGEKPPIVKDETAATEKPAIVETPYQPVPPMAPEQTLAYVRAGEGHLGANFGGATEPVDPQRARRAVDSALSSSALPAGAVRSGDVVQIPRGGERMPLEVKVEIATEAPDPLSPVVTMHMTGGDHATIVVSQGASKPAIERAVAGKLAEIDFMTQQAVAGRRVDTTSALREGSQSTELSAQDHNQIAQLKVALQQIETARGAGDMAGADQARRDAYALVVNMGLVEAPAPVQHAAPNAKAHDARVVGPEAAARRLELIEGVLGSEAAAVRALVSRAHDEAPVIADIRTQQAAARVRLLERCDALIAKRRADNIRLQSVVDAKLGADGSGVVFTRLIVGGGWAGTSDYASLGAKAGEGVPSVMVISHGGDPWLERGNLLMGQNAAELEMRGLAVQPADLAADPHDFASSRDFSAAVGASAALAGMPTYDGLVTKVEQRPAGEANGWPEGARYRLSVNGKMFYAESVDIVSGPGPANVPNAGHRINDPTGYAVDSHGGGFYRYTPGLAEQYHPIPAEDVPPSVRARLEGERGQVSRTFVDHETGYSVDTTTSPEVYRDKAGNVIGPNDVPKEVARRLGMNPNGKDNGPTLVDQQGRVQSTRVYDPESRMSVDIVAKKIYGRDGAEVDPNTLPADVRGRLGINPDGTFRDPRFVSAGNGMMVNPITGEVVTVNTGKPVDVSKLPEELRQQIESKIESSRVAFGGQRLADDYAPSTDGHTPSVLIYGAGASGAWDAEQAAASGAKVDWSGRMVLPPASEFPAGSEERIALEKLHDPKTTPEERVTLYAQLEPAIIKQSFQDGHNRRNTVPGLGAHSEEVGAKLSKKAREIVDLQPTTDGRYFVRFSDGSQGIYDKVSISIGQDAGGATGVGDLTRGLDMQALRTGGGDIAGEQDADGGLRVLGAAAMSGAMVNQLPEAQRGEIKRQSAALPSDSRNIAASIRNNAGRIAGVNEADLGGTKELSDEDRKVLANLIEQYGVPEGRARFDALHATQPPGDPSPSAHVAGQVPLKSGAALPPGVRWYDVAALTNGIDEAEVRDHGGDNAYTVDDLVARIKKDNFDPAFAVYVDEQGRVGFGNHRLLAVKQLGYTQIPGRPMPTDPMEIIKLALPDDQTLVPKTATSLGGGPVHAPAVTDAPVVDGPHVGGGPTTPPGAPPAHTLVSGSGDAMSTDGTPTNGTPTNGTPTDETSTTTPTTPPPPAPPTAPLKTV